MGYHPETLVASFPPYPRTRGKLGEKQPWSLAGAFYALSPWIGFDVWHIDPERRSKGQRTDDSCGWFDRRPGEYADAVRYLLKDDTFLHEVNLIVARKVDTVAAFYEGVSERVIAYPRLSAADTLAMCLMVARYLELRRWWNGQDGKNGAHASLWRRWASKARNVDDIAVDLALNPLDNLSTPDTAQQTVHLIAGALNRKFRPWWRHPRWHVHHWQIKFNLPRNLRRMIQPCDGCGKRLGFGYSPTVAGSKTFHGGCYGMSSAKAEAS